MRNTLRLRILTVSLALAGTAALRVVGEAETGTEVDAGARGPALGNELVNGDFDADSRGWSMPPGAETDTGVYKTGPVTGEAEITKSLRLSRPELDGWSSASQRIRIDASAFYRIQVWMKLHNAEQSHVKVTWSAMSGEPITTTFICRGLDGDTQWFKVSKSMQAPERAATAVLQFWAGSSLDNKNAGVSWFDAIEFVKFQAAPKDLTRSEWLEITRARYGEAMIAPPMTERVVYYDELHDRSGVHNPERLLAFLNKRGFVTRDADALRSWMQEKMIDGADGTVCIMAMGMAPDTITETADAKCTFRRYLDAGGKIAWIGDVPLFYQSHTDRAHSSGAGAPVVLGIQGGKWDLTDHLGECGVISGTAAGSYVTDEALKYGLRAMSVSWGYYNSMVSRNKNLELHMRVSNGSLPQYHYGGQSKAPTCMGNPINRERINEILKSEIAKINKYPAFMKRIEAEELSSGKSSTRRFSLR